MVKLVQVLSVCMFAMCFLASNGACGQQVQETPTTDTGVFVVQQPFDKIPKLIVNGGAKDSITFLQPNRDDRIYDLNKKFEPQKNVLWVSFKNRLDYKQLVTLIDALNGIETLIVESTIYPDLAPNNKFYNAIRSSVPEEWIEKLKREFPKIKIKRSVSVPAKPQIAILFEGRHSVWLNGT